MGNQHLTLDDLASRRESGRDAIKILVVKVPTALLARIDAVAETLGTSKTEVIIAILNEGLEKADSELKGWKAPPKPVISNERRCAVSGCEREKVAKGLCMKHYVARRRGKG